MAEREEEARKGLELLFHINGNRFRFEDKTLKFHDQRRTEITGKRLLKNHP